MHQKIKVNLNALRHFTVIKICAAGSFVFLGACASGPVATVEDRTVRTETVRVDSPELESTESVGDTTTPYFERQYQLEQAEYYQRQATDTEDRQRTISNILNAAEFYIQANNIDQALSVSENLNGIDLNQSQWARYQIILAYADYSSAQFASSLSRLNKIINIQPEANSGITQQIVDALLLSSFCYQEMLEYESAISALLDREALLFGKAKAETSRYIWQVIDNVPLETREQILKNSLNYAVRNRVEQSLQGQIGAQANEPPQQFDQWRSKPIHSEESQLIDNLWGESSPRTISLLLPLTSRFGKAASAVLEGIQYQHSLNDSNFRPRLQVFDIGSDPQLTQQYYFAAAQQGSDLIIGPLGKEYANQLTRASSQGGPATILLGGDLPLGRSMFRLSLSPEQQGELVAQRAMERGFVNAAILSPDSNSGKRTAQAFSDQWLGNGGKLSKSILYSPKQFDHSVELRQMFDISQSEYRHNALSNTLGYKPNFAPYRRNDIDFIFMISDIKAGRILRPQINFFSGNRLPVIATSSIYNGIEDQANNMDLDKTEFPIMPWIMKSKDISAYAGQLNQLFAMGADAYALAADLQRLRNNPYAAIEGNMGRLSVKSSGEISHQPAWARFSNGLVESNLVTAPLSEGAKRRMRILGERARSGQSGGQNYNDSNWDHRQSRRKDGT